jgi:lipopolysaccharide export system permease protein
MNKIPKKLYFYIGKNFLIKFINVVIATSLMIMVFNLFDVSGKVGGNIKWSRSLQLAAFQIPGFLEDMSMFLVMLAAMITLSALSAKSEITIMRSAGLSLWQILQPLIICAFILGVFLVVFFGPFTILANKKYSQMEQKYINLQGNDILEPPGGIWLRQKNVLKKNEEIIIRANKVYKKNLELTGVSLWFFNSDGGYYKKIDAKKMQLRDDYWELKDVVINDDFNVNRRLAALNILTYLQPQFIIQKIINNFDNVKLFSIFDLPKLIVNLEESGFSSRKFVIYYYSLLNKPFIFVSMVLIAAFFGINNFRNKNNILYISAGIMAGLVLYIGLEIINAFGASGLIPPFTATWLVSLILLTATILLVFKKENV